MKRKKTHIFHWIFITYNRKWNEHEDFFSGAKPKKTNHEERFFFLKNAWGTHFGWVYCDLLFLLSIDKLCSKQMKDCEIKSSQHQIEQIILKKKNSLNPLNLFRIEFFFLCPAQCYRLHFKSDRMTEVRKSNRLSNYVWLWTLFRRGALKR